MDKTGNPQTNTRVYWNHIYTTPAREAGYWTDTARFPTALNYIKNGDKFLDLGCGVAIPERMIVEKKKGCEVWGVDISDEVITNNKKDISQGKFFQGEIGNLGFLPTEYFDVVFSGETLEHLDTPIDLFKDAFRTLKKGGKLIITTPIENRIDSPEHVWLFTKRDIENLYKDSGFTSFEFIKLPDTEHLVVFFVVGTK